MRSLLSRLFQRWLLVVILLTGCFYFTESGRVFSKWVLPEAGGYNGGYAHALLAGHLYIKLAPPEMARLADPYDPAQYLPFYTFDLSYYKGAIYSYFGVAPALLLYVPWTVLTGTYLSEQFGVGLLMTLGFAVSVTLLAALRRRYLPRASEWSLFLGVLVIALGSHSLLLFWPPYYSQVVQSCARLLQIGALGAAFLALQSTRRARIWLAASSLCAGLMVVARPSFFPAIFLLVPPWWVATRQLRATLPSRRAGWLGLFLATLTPISIVGMGLMWFNYARFDSPLEFGTTYQQFGQDLRDFVQMSPEFLIPNALLSLFHLPTFTRYFPFMLYQSDPIGSLVLMPFSWLALLTFFGWRAQTKDRSAFGALTLSFLIAPVGNLLMLACYYLAWVRHHVDIVMPLSFAGAVGLLAGSHAWQPYPLRRRVLACVAPMLVAVNLWVTVCFYFTFPGQPETPWLTKLFNTPVYLWEKLSGAHIGDTLAFNITFPPGRIGTTEALLSTGTNDADICYVHYLDINHIALGFFHSQLGAIESAPISVAAGKAYRVEFALGSLCPPIGHPAFQNWPPEAIARAKRQLRMRIEGRTVISQEINFHPSSPGDVLVGRSPSAFAYQKFSGTLRAVDVPPLSPSPPRLAVWPAAGLTFEFQLTNRRLGRSDPIFSIGRREAGDLLFVTYPDPTHVQFGWDHGLAGRYFSPPLLAPDDGRTHHLSVQVEPTGATDTSIAGAAVTANAGRITLRFDNTLALEIPAAPYSASTETACFGVLGFPAATEPIFGGRIISVEAVVPVSLK